MSKLMEFGRSDRRIGVAMILAALVCLGLALAQGAPGAAARRGFSSTDFTNHVKALAKKVPSGFTVLVQPPFVVIGDQSPREVQRWATGTVKWAVDHLKKDYFQRDPEEIIDIWLFQDKTSYEKNVRKIFNEDPVSPFGYYSPSHRALIMNIGTGGGTLVHEIVHPFVRANFPECPAWFNEGLGSLYEQCGEKNGHIYGYTNWRLPILQNGIRSGETLPFDQLLTMSDTAFYKGRSIHYAQARYLCYYLQEQGLLVKFYHDFLTHANKDPTGLKTLKKILGQDDLGPFKKNWEAFVLKLKFNE